VGLEEAFVGVLFFTIKSKEGFAMLMSRLSSKGQVTIPKKIRDALDLSPGDRVGYELEDGSVRLRRVDPFDAAFHDALSGTLDEWASAEDEEAFRDL
jgi:AbrB family looped-hinge helix DNA binding protein